jgi:hypothetical protein
MRRLATALAAPAAAALVAACSFGSEASPPTTATTGTVATTTGPPPITTSDDPGGVIAEATLADLRRRPLFKDRLLADEPCPERELTDFSPAFEPGLGRGPAYPVGFSDDGTLTFEHPPPAASPFAGTGWGGSETLWVVDPSYGGPLIIRGRQLDGPNEVRFDLDAGKLRASLAFPAGTGKEQDGWRTFATHTRLRAPGCYAYQVDGSTFSLVIVFAAADAS